MKAQDKPDIDIFYDVHIDYKDQVYFCKRYKRKRNAKLLAKGLELKYGHWGYTIHIDVIEIPTAGLRPENGGHSTGTPSQVQDNSPVG